VTAGLVTKGIILAAGRGSRMGGLTSEKPKSLFEVDGKPLIETQIEAMALNNITNVGIVTGYKCELLNGYGSVKFFNERWHETQMVSSLECASNWLADSNFIISYSDIFYEKEAVKLLLNQEVEIAITYDANWLVNWSERFDNPCEDAESFSLSSDGFLSDIGRKNVSLEQINGQFMGLLYVSVSGWSKLKKLRRANTPEKNRKQDMTNLLQQAVVSGNFKIKAVPYFGKWGELDTPSDLSLYASKKGFSSVR
jgi:L-glutamine-phosphate cytidylyltransferase